MRQTTFRSCLALVFCVLMPGCFGKFYGLTRVSSEHSDSDTAAEVKPHSIKITSSYVGNSNNVSCTASGNPTPNVTLSMYGFENKTALHTTSAAVGLPYIGPFPVECIAQNRLGTIRKVQTLDILAIPHDINIYLQQYQHEVRCFCHAPSNPRANVTLIANNKIVKGGGAFIFLALPPMDGVVKAKCIATNQCGTRSRSQNFTVRVPCQEETKLYNDTGVIVSHPGVNKTKYGMKSKCKWIIFGRKSKTVRLHFKQFSVYDHGGGCEDDFLVVYDGIISDAEILNDKSTQISRMCGRNKPIPSDIYSSNGRGLTLIFQSDDTLEGKGFEIIYELVPSNSRTIHVKAGSGHIISYIGNDSDNHLLKHQLMNKTWIIAAKSGNKVEIDFSSFNLRNTTNCEVDSVTLYDGPSVFCPKIKKICRIETVENNTAMESTGRFMTMSFVSTSYDGQFGFAFNYHNKPTSTTTEMSPTAIIFASVVVVASVLGGIFLLVYRRAVINWLLAVSHSCNKLSMRQLSGTFPKDDAPLLPAELVRV